MLFITFQFYGTSPYFIYPDYKHHSSLSNHLYLEQSQKVQFSRLLETEIWSLGIYISHQKSAFIAKWIKETQKLAWFPSTNND